MNQVICQREENEWDEEELSSDSEVTLVKFDSQLIEDEKESLQDLLQQFSVDDRKYFIINRDKGEIIDMRNGAIVLKFPKAAPKRQESLQSSRNTRQKCMKRESISRNVRVSNNSIENQLPRNTRLTKSISAADNAWDDYWDQCEKIHQKFLMSICQKDYHYFNELFNKKFNPYHININFKSFDNWTPIHFAALHGNTVALDTLLSYPELLIEALTNFKESALHVASKSNRIDAIKILLKSGINSNLQDEDGNTALHYAVEFGHKDLVSLLMQNPKVDSTIKNNKGLSPKDLCSSKEMMRIFQPQQEEGSKHKFGFLNTLARKNRYVEKLLMRGNETEIRAEKEQNKEIVQVAHKMGKKENKESPKKIQSKKENIVRMYQLLKEKKPVERINLDCFKFYKKIGEGAFGEVYIVKKGKSEKLYALKAIKKQKIIGTNLMRYIQTEKEVLSLIKHPFIVHLHFAFQTESHLFLVMDYCEGGDLGRFLEKKKKFNEEIVRYYAAEILLALEALHHEKIIYRDMKPDNIVLDKDGHALLTDFGLSKKTVSLDDINKSFCGTPAYLPLEIINKKGHNRMADWYEFGVVLYELFTGIPPFFAETKTELYQNVRAGIIRFPRGTSEAFRDLIKRLLSQNPEKRLGFVNDAESIKEHKWFQGIDWQAVYNRELPVPKIENKVTIEEPMKTKFIDERTQKYLISDWSFIAS